VARPEAAAIHQHEDIRFSACGSDPPRLFTFLWVGCFLCRPNLFGLHLPPPFEIESFAALYCWFGSLTLVLLAHLVRSQERKKQKKEKIRFSNDYQNSISIQLKFTTMNLSVGFEMKQQSCFSSNPKSTQRDYQEKINGLLASLTNTS